MSSFIPGPWKLSNFWGGFHTPKRKYIRSESGEVGEVYWNIANDIKEETADANARLISESPNMYEQLAVLMNWYTNINRQCHSDNALDDIVADVSIILKRIDRE